MISVVVVFVFIFLTPTPSSSSPPPPVQIQFLDPKSNSTLSFYTSLSFTLDPPHPPFQSDALSFWIANSLPQNVSDSVYFSPDSVFFSVSFDMGQLRVDVDSIPSFLVLDLTQRGISFTSKQIYTWIEYWKDQKAMLVFVSYSPKRKGDDLVVAVPIDLSRFKGSMYVGLSAGRRGCSEPKIHHLFFKTSGKDREHPAGSESCEICFSEDSIKEETTETGLENSNLEVNFKLFMLISIVSVSILVFQMLYKFVDGVATIHFWIRMKILAFHKRHFQKGKKIRTLRKKGGQMHTYLKKGGRGLCRQPLRCPTPGGLVFPPVVFQPMQSRPSLKI